MVNLEDGLCVEGFEVDSFEGLVVGTDRGCFDGGIDGLTEGIDVGLEVI